MSVPSPTPVEKCAGSLLSPPSSPQAPAGPSRTEVNWRTPWPASRSMSPALAKADHHGSEKLRLRQEQPNNNDHKLVSDFGKSHTDQQRKNMKEDPTESMRENDLYSAKGGQRRHPYSWNQSRGPFEEAAFEENFEESVEDFYPRFIPDVTVASGDDAFSYYDDDYAMTASDLDETAPEGNAVKTAADERAEKRKMKRFRLTHSQTRFLQSEFARQAHPDAAQRERLSKEIPGLSPRQVQVWFQNRRAKMKRLTIDDRERIMRSRALPEDFDTTQALHADLMRPAQFIGGPSTGHSPSFMNDEDSVSHGLRSHNGRNLIGSPNSIDSSVGDFYTASGPGPTAEMMSPISITHETPHLSGSSTPQATNPHQINPFSRSRSFPLLYQPQSYSPNIQTQDSSSRRRAESLASPSGLGLPVAEGSWDHGPSQTSGPHRSPSFATPFGQAYINSTNATDDPQKLQFSTVQDIFAPEIRLNVPPDGQWQGFHRSSINQNESNTASFSPDPSTLVRHQSLADRSNFYEDPGQPSHLPHNIQALQTSVAFHSPNLALPFSENYDIEGLQQYQTAPEQEKLAAHISGPLCHQNFHFTASEQQIMNMDGSNNGAINHQSEKASS